MCRLQNIDHGRGFGTRLYDDSFSRKPAMSQNRDRCVSALRMCVSLDISFLVSFIVAMIKTTNRCLPAGIRCTVRARCSPVHFYFVAFSCTHTSLLSKGIMRVIC